MSDAATTALLEWAKSRSSSAELAPNGDTLTIGGSSVSARENLHISFEGKSCSYSVASVFLQLQDPNQSLVVYRSNCKKYNVKDNIKAKDKFTVLGFFLGVSSGLASETPTSAEPAPASRPEGTDDSSKRKTSSSKSDDHRKKKSKHESSSKRREERMKSSSSKPKKPKSLITNEQLFDSLNVVVGKRKTSEMNQNDYDELAKALNADGFGITPDLLEEQRESIKDITAREVPVGNSASILRAVNPRKDLSRVLELFNESMGSGKSSSSRRSAPLSRPQSTAKQTKTYLVGKKPVIIVPKGMTAALTMVNAHEFFSNAKFVPRDIMVKQGRHRSPVTTFTRTFRGPTGASGLVEYEIIDSPRKLGSSEQEWERVVAVIVLGQSWQFKDWLRGYNSPATLFEKVYGYFISMEGDKIPADVPGWAVKQARLNRDKRGLDQVTYAAFWNGLDEWMRVNKSELLPMVE